METFMKKKLFIPSKIKNNSKIYPVLLNKADLIAFEKDIKSTFEKGKIRKPIHLSGGNEDQLINIFKYIASILGLDSLKKQTVMRFLEFDNNRKKGYVWYPELKISIQGYDANHTLKEIIRLCTDNKIDINLLIQLVNEKNLKLTVTDGVFNKQVSN